MFRPIFAVCLMMTFSVPLNGSRRILKMVYKPYGPKMCQELCRESNDSFKYIEKDISCHRILTNVSTELKSDSSDDWLTCLTEKNTLQKLNVEVVPTGDKKSLQHNPNKNLLQACEIGQLCVVQYIVWNELADINCRGILDRTPVMVAALTGQVTVFDFLVSEGSDLSLVDDDNNTLLHAACMGGNTDIVKKLIDSNKLNIEARDKDMMTPLLKAVSAGQREVFDLLLIEGCAYDAVDDKGFNILHLACGIGHVYMVKVIIHKHLVDIDSRGGQKMTPVIVASMFGHKEVVKVLLKNNCSLTAVNKNGHSALHIACIKGYVETVGYILTHDEASKERRGVQGYTPIMTAAYAGHTKLFEFLVNKQCILTKKDNHGNNILHQACGRGHVDMVNYILSHNIVDIESRGYEGRTPVLATAVKGHRGVLDLLVKKRCNLKALDDNENNILHIACLGGHVNMVEYILTLGVVKVNEKNKRGRKAITVAKNRGHEEIVALLKARI